MDAVNSPAEFCINENRTGVSLITISFSTLFESQECSSSRGDRQRKCIHWLRLNSLGVLMMNGFIEAGYPIQINIFELFETAKLMFIANLFRTIIFQ
jgi:hypothetical protein